MLILFFLFSGCLNTQINNNLNYSKNEIDNLNKNIVLDEMSKNNSTINSLNKFNSSVNFQKDITNIKKIDKRKDEELIEANKRFKEVMKNNSFNSIWYQPKPRTTWFIQLSNSENVNTDLDYEVYDLDLVETSQEIIDELHKKEKKVICYFSGGSWEVYRDDANEFPKEVLGNILDGWPDEKWLDISNYEKFSNIMEKRLDLAVKKKCEGVDIDNLDGFTNKNGFNLNYNDQLKYDIWLAEEAHKRNLSVGLKNDLLQIKDLEPYFDFAVNEQCFYYDECDYLKPFIKNNKAVFGIEYDLHMNKFCDKANQMNFSEIKTNYDLNGKIKSCLK